MPSERQRRRGYSIPDNVRDLPLVCVTLKVPDAKSTIDAVRSELDRLGYFSNWEMTDTPGDRRATEMAQYWRELMYSYFRVGDCENEMTFIIRQNPDDPCKLEYSTNNGITWVEGFDYALCKPQDLLERAAQERAILDYLKEILAQFDGSPASIATDVDPATLIGERAICYSLLPYIRQVVEAYVETQRRIQEEGELIPNAISVGLLGAGAALAIIASAGTVSIYMAAGVTAAGGALQAWLAGSDYDASDMRDEDAQQEIVCYLHENFPVNTFPTQSQFAAVLANHTLTGNAAKIADVLFYAMQDEESYVTWLAMVNDLARIGELLPPCPCDEWCQHWLGSTGSVVGLTVNSGTLNTTPPTSITPVSDEIDVEITSITMFFADSMTLNFSGIGTPGATVRVYKQTTSGGTWEQTEARSEGNGAAIFLIEDDVFGLRFTATRPFSFSVDGIQIEGSNATPPQLNGSVC